MISITIPGELRGKGRPRFSRAGHAYTPEATRNAEAFMRARAAEAYLGAPLDGPVSMSVTIGVAVPRSWPKKKRERALSGLLWPTVRPDLDNIVKALGDSLKGIVWLDDSQVVSLHVVRRYADAPLSTVVITEV